MDKPSRHAVPAQLRSGPFTFDRDSQILHRLGRNLKRATSTALWRVLDELEPIEQFLGIVADIERTGA